MSTAAIIKPGNSVNDIGELSTQEAAEGQGILDWLVSIVPANPFEAFATGNLLQVIFTAILIIVGIVLLGKKQIHLYPLLKVFMRLLGKITSVVLKLSPIGVFALIASVIATQGMELVQKVMYIVGLILAVVVMIFAYFLFLSFMKISPVRFWKSFLPAFGIVFGTSNSNAALPVAIENAQDPFKMKREIASFAISLGTALKRDGAGIMQGFNALFVAQLFNIELPNPHY